MSANQIQFAQIYVLKDKVTCENEAKVGKNSFISSSISSSDTASSVVVVVLKVDVITVSSSPKSKSNWSDGIFKTRLNN